MGKVLERIFHIVKLSLPTACLLICLFLQQTICLAFIANKYNNPRLVDGVGLSHLYVNCTMFSFSEAIISGLEILLSNAYGSKKHYLMGLYLHRGRIISLICIIFLTVVNRVFALSLLRFFNVDEEVIHYTKDYLYVLLWFPIINIQFGCCFRFLNITGKTNVNLLLLAGCIVLHPLWCHLFINVLDMGISGAGYAFILSQILVSCGISVYMHFYNPIPETYFMINKDCFKGWKEYLKIALPNGLLKLCEWWGIEIQAIIAIYLSPLDYSVHIILFNIELLVFAFSLGCAISTVIMIGTSIGEVNTPVEETKALAKTIVKYIFCFMLCLVCLLYSLRYSILSLFMKPGDLLEKCLVVFPLVMTFNFVDSHVHVLSGISKGLAQQKVPTCFAIFVYYVLQICLSLYLAIYKGLGVEGIWISLITGSSTLVCFLLLYLRTLDFQKIKDDTHLRLNRDHNLISNNSKDMELVNNPEFN